MSPVLDPVLAELNQLALARPARHSPDDTDPAIADYLARGGRITRLPMGATGIGVLESHLDTIARDWRRRQAATAAWQAANPGRQP